jgi:hypothetical protein
MFACFQPNIWVGPVLPSAQARFHAGNPKDQPRRGEVRFKRVFNPKTQVESASTINPKERDFTPKTEKQARHGVDGNAPTKPQPNLPQPNLQNRRMNSSTDQQAPSSKNLKSTQASLVHG